MDFKQAKIDWIDILQNGIVYSYVNRRKLSTNDESKNIEWAHWRKTSPVYARYRSITLEWVVDRMFWWEEERVQHLESLFSLQWDVSTLEPRELYIKDNFWNEWKLNVKVKEAIEFVEWDENFVGSHWKWRVVLESVESPIFKSYEELFVDWNEWNFWGFIMDFELENAWDEFDEVIEIKTWAMETYTRFEILVHWELHSPFNIHNITKNTFFALDITAVEWDKIVIDSEKFTATLNWENVIANRTPGSQWQRVSWTTLFIITDKDWNIFEKDFSVRVYYSNALL